jgi:hypothetical protein
MAFSSYVALFLNIYSYMDIYQQIEKIITKRLFLSIWYAKRMGRLQNAEIIVKQFAQANMRMLAIRGWVTV